MNRNGLGYEEHISEHGVAPIKSGTVTNTRKKYIYGEYAVVASIGDKEIIPELEHLI